MSLLFIMNIRDLVQSSFSTLSWGYGIRKAKKSRAFFFPWSTGFQTFLIILPLGVVIIIIMERNKIIIKLERTQNSCKNKIPNKRKSHNNFTKILIKIAINEKHS